MPRSRASIATTMFGVPSRWVVTVGCSLPTVLLTPRCPGVPVPYGNESRARTGLIPRCPAAGQTAPRRRREAASPAGSGDIPAPLVLSERTRAGAAPLVCRRQAPRALVERSGPGLPAHGIALVPGVEPGGTRVDVPGPAVVLEERDLGRDLPAQ